MSFEKSKVFQTFNPLKLIIPETKPKEPELSVEEEELLTILSWRRAYGSFGVTLLEEHIKMLCPDAEMDDHGNLWVVTNKDSRTLFTAHTDTVHSPKGALKQEILYDPYMKIVYKNETKDDHDCLGADDGAGIWLLLKMVEAEVPGTYVFFTGEECGGIGSRAAATHDSHKFKRFDQAIAFDRKGTSSVITHQFSRCCSDVYGKTLADALTDAMGGKFAFALDDGGIFTDTANLTDIIPECTNISVGYEFAHTVKETLDVEFLLALRDCCLTLDWAALPIKRDPSEVDYSAHHFDFDRYGSKATSPTRLYGTSYTATTGFIEDFGDAVNVTAETIPDMTYPAMIRYVRKNPELAAELLQDMADELARTKDDLDDAWGEIERMEMTNVIDKLEDF